MTTTLDHAPAAALPPAPDAARRTPSSGPAWWRPALFGLLALTAGLYLWDLAASGTANSFYAAAVQAGAKSWKAWFFGSLDAGNSITVDKPPASLWVMGLSARVFGFNSWSLLVPQALEGVAAVGLLAATVRRWSGPVAGLLAGAALALTPAATLMFRFDNPDALLTLLLVASAYATTRYVERGATRWMVLAGSALGFAFLTKMLQAFLVLPALGIVVLVATPTSVRRRLLGLAVGALSMVVAAGWWVAAVALTPASARPYIGGSTNNTVLQLVFGYNGLARLEGQSQGGGGMSNGASGSSFGGATGLFRIFGTEMGAEVSWLIPAAAVALIAGFWLTRKAARTDRTRAGLLLWGGWLVVTTLVLDYMKGVVHPYYTVALAPAVAASLAIGAGLCWRRREEIAARLGLAGMTAGAGWWGYTLLSRNASWHPALRYLILFTAGAAAVTWALPIVLSRRTAVGLVAAGVVAGLAGPAAYSVATAASPHTGSIPSVGPASAGSGGGFGGAGGPGGDAATSTALSTLLEKAGTTWSAATSGDQSAASLELATGTSVMAIGGWSGSDPSPTLAQFVADVQAGRIHYFISGGQGGQGGPGGGSSATSAIASWVAAHYTATTVGGTTVYDLTTASSTGTTT